MTFSVTHALVVELVAVGDFVREFPVGRRPLPAAAPAGRAAVPTQVALVGCAHIHTPGFVGS